MMLLYELVNVHVRLHALVFNNYHGPFYSDVTEQAVAINCSTKRRSELPPETNIMPFISLQLLPFENLLRVFFTNATQLLFFDLVPFPGEGSKVCSSWHPSADMCTHCVTSCIRLTRSPMHMRSSTIFWSFLSTACIYLGVWTVSCPRRGRRQHGRAAHAAQDARRLAGGSLVVAATDCPFYTCGCSKFCWWFHFVC